MIRCDVLTGDLSSKKKSVSENLVVHHRRVRWLETKMSSIVEMAHSQATESELAPTDEREGGRLLG